MAFTRQFERQKCYATSISQEAITFSSDKVCIRSDGQGELTDQVISAPVLINVLAIEFSFTQAAKKLYW